MLRSVKDFHRYHIMATDGEIGKADDLLFDDREWRLRHLVIDTGHWLPDRKVLIPPSKLGRPDGVLHTFPVNLTKQQIEDSPTVDTDEPVSRQHEAKLFEYYGLQPYWVSGITGGAFPPAIYPADEEAGQEQEESTGKKPEEDTGDPHLRSTNEVEGYHIRAVDDQVGHIEDFVIDDHTWTVRYLVVDTRDWLPGRLILVATTWITGVSWDESRVYVSLTKDAIEKSPEWDPSQPVNREYEEVLFDYYGRPRYWD